jgi:hypothetical protein
MKNLSPSINSLAVATYFASNISATINQGLSEKLLKESKAYQMLMFTQNKFYVTSNSHRT